MLLIMNIDPATQAQALASVLALASANGVKFKLRDVASAPVQAPAPALQPKAERKELAPAEDVTLSIEWVDKRKRAFTLGFGGGRSGAKLQIKAAGCVWDGTIARKDGKLGAWVAPSKDALAKAGINGDVIAVSAQSVQAGRDKAQAKAERKAQRG